VTTLTRWQAVLGVAGIAILGYGIRTDRPGVRWLGIAVLAAAALLRFVKRRTRH
jgi:hypothetical protein